MIGTPAKTANLHADHLPPLIKPRHRPRPANAQDRHLAGHDHRGDIRAAYGADVADGDGAGGQVCGREVPRASERLQAGEGGGDVEDGEGGDVFDDGYQEAVGRVHRDADVVGFAHGQSRRVGRFEAGVEERVFFEGDGDGFEDEGEGGEFVRVGGVRG